MKDVFINLFSFQLITSDKLANKLGGTSKELRVGIYIAIFTMIFLAQTSVFVRSIFLTIYYFRSGAKLLRNPGFELDPDLE